MPTLSNEISPCEAWERDWDVGFLTVFLYCIPIAWVTGLGFVLFHVLAIGLLRRVGIRNMDGFGFLIFATFVILFVSLMMNYVVRDISVIRLIASLNNLSVLLVALMFYRWGAAINWGSVPRKGRHVRALFVVITLYYGLSVILMAFSIAPLKFPTLMGYLPDLPGILAAYQTLILSKLDWFGGGLKPRTIIYAPFPTSSAAAGLLLTSIVLVLKRVSLRKGFGVLVLATGIIYITTLTRSGLVGGMLGLAFIAMFLVPWQFRFLTGLAGFCFCILVSGGLVEQLLNAREASNESRFSAYHYTLTAVTKINPILGLGVRPTEEELHVPVGSHSTYLSLFTRGGVFALLTAVCALIFINLSRVFSLLWRIADTRSFDARIGLYSAFSVIVCVVWMGFGDIDAYPVVACPAFLCMGILAQATLKLRRKRRSSLRFVNSGMFYSAKADGVVGAPTQFKDVLK